MDITQLKGVGESLAAAMKEQGLGDLRTIARATIDELSAVPGIAPSSAKRIRKQAKKLITPQVSMSMSPPRPAPSEAKAKPDPKKGSTSDGKRSKKQKKALAKAKTLRKKAGKLGAKMKKLLEKAKRAERRARG